MGNILGIIGDLIPIIAGVYCVIYFGGYKEPRTIEAENQKSFNNIKEKHGKKIKFLGYFLIIFGVFNLIKYFIL